MGAWWSIASCSLPCNIHLGSHTGTALSHSREPALNEQQDESVFSEQFLIEG